MLARQTPRLYHDTALALSWPNLDDKNWLTGMIALRDAILTAPDAALCLGGLVIGFCFGWVLNATNYCVMGAVSDWRLGGDKGRLGAAALAAAVAIIGAQGLDAAGVVDLSKTMYLTPRINWLGASGGGLLFGFGMVYAGGCPSRTLVRAGSGDVRGFVSLLTLALAALATVSGILGGLRSTLQSSAAIDLAARGVETQSLAGVIAASGLDPATARLAASALIVIPLVLFAIGPARIFSTPRNVAAALAVGALVTLGWALTGLAADDMAVNPQPPASLSFVRPVADAIDWIERSTALGLPGFGAASVFGVLMGSFAAALASGTLRYAGFADGGDLRRHVAGAAAMGVGGVLALGCSIGQGVTGLSTLSVQSVIAAAAIIGGAVLGLARLQRIL